jgi:DNA-binding NtrC family response regulator
MSKMNRKDHNVNIDGWNLKGVSQHILELRAKIKDIAQKPLTVLIQGPTGTGKELVAKDIHEHSPRKEKPFVPVNCGAIPADLLESELFGYEKGAFTGANKPKKGQIELPNGGTLFLDEVGDLRTDHQGKLLRFLENKTYLPVGGEKEKSADVRVIAATNKDLMAKAKGIIFRDDLYYRLCQLNIKTAALKDRPEDIVYLLNHFSKLERLEINAKIKILLYSYYYPGNVRELKNYLYKDYDQIIEGWKDELIAQGFDREIITDFSSYEDFDYLIRQARNHLFYSHQWVSNGNALIKKPADPWAEKVLKDQDVHDWLKAISFVGESNCNLGKIVEAYEIITLLRSGMLKSKIVDFLQIRREKVSPEFFREYYGLPWPETNEPLIQSASLKLNYFPLFRAELSKLQEMVTHKILNSLS